MRKILPLTIITTLCCVAFCPRQASALNMSAPPKPEPKPEFVYNDSSGKKHSVEIVDKYQPKKIVHPFATIDSKIDPKLRRAATIAEERARAHSHSQCWRFVKEALVAAGLVYGAGRAAGHVEIRTVDGFVSDFRSKTPSRRPLIGVYTKA